LRIVQIINSLETGGAEKLVLQLHARFMARGHESSLVALSGPVPTGITGLWTAGMGSPYAPAALAAVADLPAGAGLDCADIIHVHLFPAQFLIPLALPAQTARLVTTEHSTANRRRRSIPGRLLDCWTYSRYSRVACVSPAAAQALGAWIPGVRERLRVVPNGIDLSLYGRARARDEEGSIPVVLSVGRLIPAKNYGVALEAVATLLHRGRELVYRIAGDGPLRADLELRVQELGIAGSVEFLGTVTEVAELLASADIFFMPSSREGFGLAAVEAMASGLPVVAADVPGLGDLLGRDGTCGLLSPSESPDAFAGNIERLLGDPILRRTLGEEGRRTAGKYDIEETADRYLRLYTEVMEEGGTG
jgi:glycosyltransferase involved in cell wall biosynthesis